MKDIVQYTSSFIQYLIDKDAFDKYDIEFIIEENEEDGTLIKFITTNDLNDYIVPSQAYIKPAEVNKISTDKNVLYLTFQLHE